MTRRPSFLAIVAAASIGCSVLPTRLPAGRCVSDADCGGGMTCDPQSDLCIRNDGGAGDGGVGDGGAGDGGPDGALPDGPECATNSACHDPMRPLCGANGACVGCAAASAPSCSVVDPARPACGSAGACVECMTSSQCTKDAAKPLCGNAGMCVGCSDPSAPTCTSADPTHPVCGSSGACVECAMSSQCTKDVAKPLCGSAGTCVGCSDPAAPTCASADSAHPVCGSAGACVECTASSQCTASATKPVCDSTTNKCRSCKADSECPADPGVCMSNIDGHCALPAETLYVQNSASCSDAVVASDASAATSAKPLCSMQPVATFLTSTRSLVVIRGTVEGAAAAFLPAGVAQATFVGQQSAVIGSVTAPAFSLQAGIVYLRDLEFSTPGSVGISGIGGTLHVDTVTVDSCKKGGIFLDGTAFDIRNTTVTNNGPGQSGAVTWGGILVNALPASGPTQLNLVTVENNKQVGIVCSAAITGSGVLASGNTGGVDISTTCGITPCPAASATCGAQ